MRKLQLVDDDLSDRDAKLCFVFSRMCVIDGESARGRAKESHLPFEGFLEALCRLAALKALPTDEEVKAAGHADAGGYLLQLRDEKPNLYEALLRERAVPLGGQLAQPIWRCVDHLVSLMIRTIEEGTAGKDDLQLSEHEAKNFLIGKKK